MRDASMTPPTYIVTESPTGLRDGHYTNPLLAQSACNYWRMKRSQHTHAVIDAEPSEPIGQSIGDAHLAEFRDGTR